MNILQFDCPVCENLTMADQWTSGRPDFSDNVEPYFVSSFSTMTLEDGTRVGYVPNNGLSTCPFPILAMTFDRRLTDPERKVVKAFMGFPEQEN